jgi:hypothetical protein
MMRVPDGGFSGQNLLGEPCYCFIGRNFPLPVSGFQI